MWDWPYSTKYSSNSIFYIYIYISHVSIIIELLFPLLLNEMSMIRDINFCKNINIYITISQIEPNCLHSNLCNTQSKDNFYMNISKEFALFFMVGQSITEPLIKGISIVEKLQICALNNHSVMSSLDQSDLLINMK